jgi:hypothetical protein
MAAPAKKLIPSLPPPDRGIGASAPKKLIPSLPPPSRRPLSKGVSPASAAVDQEPMEHSIMIAHPELPQYQPLPVKRRHLPIPGESLVAEFKGKQALLTTLIAEPVLRAQVALASLRGTKEEHFDAAARYSLPMLRALVALHGKSSLYVQLTCAAAGAGNLPCLQYLHEKGSPWCPKDTEYFEQVERGYKTTTFAAAKSGHLNCLQYAHEHGYAWGRSTTFAAAEGGYLACLQYAHKNGAPWGEDATHSDTTMAAAAGGHLECLQYAHEHGCPWDRDTTAAAAKRGYIACIRYAHENGCPWEGYDNPIHWAAAGGYMECLKYVVEHGCPWDDLFEGMTYAAAKGGHLECLRYIINHGALWNSRTTQVAAREGHLECLRYADENGAPWNDDTAAVATGACIVYCRERAAMLQA